jgi:hypothetical protein
MASGRRKCPRNRGRYYIERVLVPFPSAAAPSRNRVELELAAAGYTIAVAALLLSPRARCLCDSAGTKRMDSIACGG